MKYDYDSQQWLPADNPKIKRQEQRAKEAWDSMSYEKKKEYAVFITNTGENPLRTLVDLMNYFENIGKRGE